MKTHSQLVMESQKRHIEKHRARRAIRKKVARGLIPKANTLLCFDCNLKANCYDHYKGYKGKNRFVVQAVCWDCHRKRGIQRKEYKNGFTIKTKHNANQSDKKCSFQGLFFFTVRRPP